MFLRNIGLSPNYTEEIQASSTFRQQADDWLSAVLQLTYM
jgi:hypothetical protein